MSIWSYWRQPNGKPDKPGTERPSEGTLSWLRSMLGWPGAPAAKDTPAERELVRERVLSGPQGIKFPWFLPYFDSEQTVGENQEMRLAYRQMLKDPNVKAALFGKILAAGSLELKVIPKDRKDPQQAADAELIRWNLEEALENGVQGLIWSVLSGALIDGYSVCEKVWAREDKGEHKGAYYLRALKPKDTGRDVILETDPFRNIVGVRGLRYSAGETFHPSNFLIYRHLPLWDVATGMSDLRAVYGRFWMLDTVLKLRAVGLEKRSLPVIVGHYQVAQDRPAVEEALSLVKSQNWLAVPEGVRVEALSIAGGADGQFADACRQLSEDIFLGIAGATLQARQGDVNNARGSSAEHRNTADLFISYLTTGISQLLNDRHKGLVKDILDLNRVCENYPSVRLAAVDETDMEARLRIVTGAWEIGLQLSRSELYEELGLQPPDANDPADSLGGKADQEAQVAAAAIAAPGGPGAAAAADRVVTDETQASPGGPVAAEMGAQGVTAPTPGEGVPGEQMVEQHAEDEEGEDYQPGERVRHSALMQNKGKSGDHTTPLEDRPPVRLPGHGHGLHAHVHADQSGVPETHVRLRTPVGDRVVHRREVSPGWNEDAEDHAERPGRPRTDYNDGKGINAPTSTGAGVDSRGRRYLTVQGQRRSLARDFDEGDTLPEFAPARLPKPKPVQPQPVAPKQAAPAQRKPAAPPKRLDLNRQEMADLYGLEGDHELAPRRLDQPAARMPDAPQARPLHHRPADEKPTPAVPVARPPQAIPLSRQEQRQLRGVGRADLPTADLPQQALPAVTPPVVVNEDGSRRPARPAPGRTSPPPPPTAADGRSTRRSPPPLPPTGDDGRSARPQVVEPREIPPAPPARQGLQRPTPQFGPPSGQRPPRALPKVAQEIAAPPIPASGTQDRARLEAQPGTPPYSQRPRVAQPKEAPPIPQEGQTPPRQAAKPKRSDADKFRSLAGRQLTGQQLAHVEGKLQQASPAALQRLAGELFPGKDHSTASPARLLAMLRQGLRQGFGGAQ